MMADRFRDRVILITGASEGIGRELALQLAKEGAWLALASRTRERLEQLAQECKEHGGRAIVVLTDVADAAACRECVETTAKTLGRLDMLINNAGLSMYARFSAIQDPGMLERIVAVNFLGAIYCTSYALPFLKQTQGRIVAISSLAGKILAPGATAYGASKAAMRSFFDSLRTELRSETVSVTVAYPGFVRTEIYKRFLDPEGKPGPDMTSRIPRWTMMSVERCARRIIQAARRRRREVPPTFFDRLIFAVHRAAPWMVERFWRRTLDKDFPTGPGKEANRPGT
jgi:short-subunit dehydrogenase